MTCFKQDVSLLPSVTVSRLYQSVRLCQWSCNIIVFGYLSFKCKSSSVELVCPCSLDKRCTLIQIFSLFLFLRISNGEVNALETTLCCLGKQRPICPWSICTHRGMNLVTQSSLPQIQWQRLARHGLHRRDHRRGPDLSVNSEADSHLHTARGKPATPVCLCHLG